MMQKNRSRAVFTEKSFRTRITGGGVVALLVATIACAPSSEMKQEPTKVETPKAPAVYKITFPLGLDAEAVNIPTVNSLTEEKIKLGKRLYFEKKLSLDGSISCASCHVPEKGFADPNRFSVGIG